MLKVIAKLGDVPIGSVVTKIGGTMEHDVSDRVDVYDEDGEVQRIHANDGCCYLLSGSGNINAFGLDKEVIWHTSLDELNNLEAEKECK